MNKYRSIDRLLQYLARSIARGDIAVTDRWLDDEQAIGFYKPAAPELSAYVSIHGQPPGQYDVDLEYPALDDNDVGNIPTRSENIGIEHLIDLLVMHFDLHDIAG